ncbi:hypothetical protein MMC16_007615 [Acarospora aff. strigata]|nr:hypothetical protein [Acarospora aff. strigata]
MGGNQSSHGNNGAAHDAPTSHLPATRASYYELLGVDGQATDDDIKKAYRKKALELHPDRNYGRVEHTSELFAEVQAAYDVLSDPQERAWYDSHRDLILRGNSEGTRDHYERNIRMTTAHDIMKLFRKFNGPLDFSDSPSGFYRLLRDTFDVLAREEEIAREWNGLQPVDYPSFGHANDSYEYVVKPFYTAWGGFVTNKSFAWMDAFRYSDAPDRRVRRMMEKENKRLRDEGIREFNDAVTSLLAFVRKRDPRYIPNTQSEAERQKTLRDAAAAQAIRSRAANQAKLQEYVLPEWTKTQGQEETEESEEEQYIAEHYECVACGKTFKSEKQFDAHEKSKKHLKAVHQLRISMREDQKVLKLDGPSKPANTLSISTNLEIKQSSESTIEFELIGWRKGGDQNPPLLAAGTDSELDEHKPDSNGDSVKSRTRTEYSEEDQDYNKDDYASRENVEGRILGDRATSDSCSLSSNECPIITSRICTMSTDDYDEAVLNTKPGKAKERRAKKAARERGTQQEATEFTCATCNETFLSKTKLFRHITASNHARPVHNTTKGGKGKRR